jgi:hypothetical protein
MTILTAFHELLSLVTKTTLKQKEKLENLNEFKHQIKSILKAHALSKVPKTPQLIDKTKALTKIKRENQSKKINPDLMELKKKKDSIHDNLRRLFDIAGGDWTLDVGNTKTVENFSCPADDGYYPYNRYKFNNIISSCQLQVEKTKHLS